MLFDEPIKSEYIRKDYNVQLKPFRRYAELSSNKNLLSMTQDRLQILLEDYLMHLKRTTNPNSVLSKFQGIRYFFVMNSAHRLGNNMKDISIKTKDAHIASVYV